MIGFVIVVGLVITGAILVVFAGSTAISDLQQERTDAEAQFVMEEVDAQLTEITNSDRSATGEFSLGDLEGQESRVVRRGYLNVTVDERASCRTNVTLSSIRYESDDGGTVAYEAGGVFVGGDNGSALQTRPDLRFRNGSLDITVTNLTGEVENDRNAAFYNATSSERESARRSAKLVSGPCRRPDNVTVTVRSDYYVAWGVYLEDELNDSRSGITVETFDSNRTARAFIDQKRLPRRTDDRRNTVVNLSQSPTAAYMDDVEITGNTIRVRKGVSNDYSVYVQPLSERRLDVGRIREVEGATNVTGPPKDVVFVLDESGSMSDELPNGNTKLVAAQSAIKNFTGTLNGSRDRVALVGYSKDSAAPSWADDRAWIWRTPHPDGKYLLPPSDEFNDTVDLTDHRGGTAGSAGLHKANVVHHLKSNQTRPSIVVFLSDGEFNGNGMDGAGDNEAAEIRAEISRSQDTTVYTIGFGQSTGEFNETVLKEMASRTGGNYYYASNQSRLNAVFLNISRNIATTRQIARTPTSTNLTTGNGGTLSPQIAGDTDDLASTTRGGERFVNINDPTAPTQFSHAFALADDESVTFNASTYECAEWRSTGIVRTNESTGESYSVARCTNMTTPDFTIDADNVTIYTDGDDASAHQASSEDPAWWQDEVNDSIDNRPDVDRDASAVLSMKSNQALVVLDYPDGVNSTNKLVLLYQIGRAEEDAVAGDVINIRVRNVQADP
jgi:Mg-chelatase subunit ChlD